VREKKGKGATRGGKGTGKKKWGQRIVTNSSMDAWGKAAKKKRVEKKGELPMPSTT